MDEELLQKHEGTPYGNMLYLVEMQKEGPWFTHKEHLRDAE